MEGGETHVMTKGNAHNFGKFYQLPNPGLSAYFKHVRLGNPNIYRTNFGGKDTPLEVILDDWSNHLESVKREWPTLYDYEIDLRKKVGPMSVMKPLVERLPDIEAYYAGILLPAAPVSEEAIAKVFSEWGAASGLRVRSQNRTVELMQKSTNSGSPYFTKRRRVVSRTVPVRVWQSGDYTSMLLDGVEWQGCATLGWRGQEGGPTADDVKQRVIWMFPFGVNIQELQVYQPLIEAFQKWNLVPAWVSMDSVDARVTKLFDTKASDDLVVGTDFSAFDQHINSELQLTARKLLSMFFTDNTQWLEEVFPIKYHIPLAYDWGKIRCGAHGMGSGSGGTNADETLLHRALQHEAAMKAGKILNPYSQCLGDDGIISYSGCDVDSIVESYVSHGLEMNPSKQYASTDDCIFLRRWHHRKYRKQGIMVGVYSTMRAIGRLCEQERYYDPRVWNEKMVALRQLSILENVKYHPLCEEFARFCMVRDKYRLGLDIPGFMDKIEQYAQEAIDYMPDFLGYTRSLQGDGNPRAVGIKSWWIYNFLKSQA